MGKRGPVPKSAADLRIVGSHRASSRAAGPAGEIVRLSPSAWLSTEAKAEFGRLADLLYSAGITTESDRTALELLAVIVVKLRDVERRTADPDCDPAIRTLHRQLLRLALVYLREFGMTPASRARVPRAAAETTDDAESKLAEFLSSNT